MYAQGQSANAGASQRDATNGKAPIPSPNYREEAEKIVADERAQSEKMPVYEVCAQSIRRRDGTLADNYKQGLEGFRLVEKMGDGAFSNVYKAIERKTGRKCAVKVVRKFELNHSQVRLVLHSPSSSIIITCAYYYSPLSAPTPWPGWDPSRQSFTSTFFSLSFPFVQYRGSE